MFFQESEAIVLQHPDLALLVQRLDHELAHTSSPALLRPAEFTGALRADHNQVLAVFELYRHYGLLVTEELIECEQCENLMPALALQEAMNDEVPLECTICGSLLSDTDERNVLYRLTEEKRRRLPRQPVRTRSGRSIIEDPGVDEPLAERAQVVLIAMNQLAAFDSDTRRTTEEIAERAFGAGCDANTLKSVMSDLKTRLLIETKGGRGGGCWLTDRGRTRAEKLDT
jgi:hypothetical protein